MNLAQELVLDTQRRLPAGQRLVEEAFTSDHRHPVMVAIAENARIPIDNPATHLELTMVHEAMLLEYSGRHLALIELAASLKLLLYMSLIICMFVPWGQAPPGAKSRALISDDPDAPVGTWVHWVLYDLAPNVSELPEGLAKSQYVAGGAKQGLNDFNHFGYGGPCPPHGKPHRYFFKLYALDAVLDLKPGTRKKDLEIAMGQHILAQSQLTGTYQRK